MPTPTVVRRALDVVRRGVRADELWRPGELVLLACSGGIDSIAAWALLAELRPSLGHRLQVAWVDHGLRSDQTEVSAALSACAEWTGVPYITLTAAIAPAAPDQEANARVARYGSLRRCAAQLGAEVIATAHHADDVAETVLMRVTRGAGVGAQGAIPRRNREIVRPLLGLCRRDLEAVAAALGLAYVEDPGNADPRHERNRWRREVLPVMERVRPGAAAGLQRSARHAASAGRALNHWLEAAVAPHLRPLPEGEGSASAGGYLLPRALWPDDPDALGALLLLLAQRLEVPAPPARGVHQISAWLRASDRGAEVRVHGLRLWQRGDDLAVAATKVAPTASDTYLGDVRPKTLADGAKVRGDGDRTRSAG